METDKCFALLGQMKKRVCNHTRHVICTQRPLKIMCMNTLRLGEFKTPSQIVRRVYKHTNWYRVHTFVPLIKNLCSVRWWILINSWKFMWGKSSAEKKHSRVKIKVSLSRCNKNWGMENIMGKGTFYCSLRGVWKVCTATHTIAMTFKKWLHAKKSPHHTTIKMCIGVASDNKGMKQRW